MRAKRLVVYFHHESGRPDVPHTPVGGRYRPAFRIGGSVDVWLDDEDDPFADCADEIRKAQSKMRAEQGVEGILAVVDKVTWFSESDMGHFSDRLVYLSPELGAAEISLRATTYPESGRKVMLSGVTAAPEEFSPPDTQDEVLRSVELGDLPDLITATPELGHALGFPHSGR